MPSQNSNDYRITYFHDEIVLRGDTRKIHAEAYKILMRFRDTSLPFHIKKISDHKIVLSNRHH